MQKNILKISKGNTTIPKWINDAALAADINFLGVLQEALKEKLAAR